MKSMQIKEITTFSFLLPGIPAALVPFDVRTVAHYLMIDHLARGLVELDVNGEVVGDLAESWDVSADGMSLTFKIRDARWSDGTQISAADVVATFKAGMAVGKTTHFDFSVIEKVTAPSPNTVMMVLKQADPGILSRLATPETGIIHPSAFLGGKGPLSFAVSSGAYVLAKIGDGAVELERNPHFGEFIKNAPERVRFSLCSLESFRKQIVNQSLGISWMPDDITTEEHRRISIKGDVATFASNISFTHFLAINPLGHVFSDARRRRAIQRAIMPGTIALSDTSPKWHPARQLFEEGRSGRLSYEWLGGFWKEVGSTPTPELTLASLGPVRLAANAKGPFTQRVIDRLTACGMDVMPRLWQSSDEFSAILRKPEGYDLLLTNNDFCEEDLLDSLKVTFNDAQPLIVRSKDSQIAATLDSLNTVTEKAIRFAAYESIGRELLESGLVVPLACDRGAFYRGTNVDVSRLSTKYPDIRLWKVAVLVERA